MSVRQKNPNADLHHRGPCEHCGGTVHTDVRECPYCGYTISTYRVWTDILYLLAGIFLIVTVVGRRYGVTLLTIAILRFKKRKRNTIVRTDELN